jgi:hypothetical protein
VDPRDSSLPSLAQTIDDRSLSLNSHLDYLIYLKIDSEEVLQLLQQDCLHWGQSWRWDGVVQVANANREKTTRGNQIKVPTLYLVLR